MLVDLPNKMQLHRDILLKCFRFDCGMFMYSIYQLL
ncbi:hypothetical protein V6Z11_D12G149400 [Gossypium hirsutum]